MTTTDPSNTQQIDKLTPEQEALLQRMYDEYMADVVQPRPRDEDWTPESKNMQTVRQWLAVAYDLYKLPVPSRIEVVDSPKQAIELARTLLDDQPSVLSTDRCGMGDAGWVSAYDFFHRIKILTDDEARDVIALRDFGRVAWDTLLLDECAIVVRRPLKIAIDDRGRMHDPKGPCLVWPNDQKAYAWHGVWIPERMILDPKSYTRDEVTAITDTEQRRALCEINGWDWYAELFGATTVNTWTDSKTKLAYELLSFPNGHGSGGAVGKLLKKQSPKLQDGTQPYYVEPVHEDLRTAQAARKWQATRLSVEECERDPVLTYAYEA